ncbi:MAG: hypothetical protein OEY93_09865, partial [Anaerolineae bacterium]|nr:hypothetical protein [Anaerolineae bacterium]
GDPTVTVSIDTNCRSGPGQAYDMIGALLVTEIGKIVGVPAVNTPYVIIKNPDGGADCWVWLEYATTNGNLDNLPKINVPPTPTPKVGGIKGMVWEDKCNPAAPGSPPPGCIDPPVPGPYIANGTFDGGESGIKGVVLDLGKGACFSTGFKTATTNNSGNYSFDNLQPGKYCVSITANLHGNDSDLIPGYWSFPYTLSITASYTITVDGGVIVTGINFGWDFD